MINLLLVLLLQVFLTIQDPRIISGETVKDRTKFAYQASIRYKDVHICGGALLDVRNVLTAAHCFNSSLDLSDLSVFIGGLSISTPKQWTSSSVQHVFVHEDYDVFSFDNDIAIVRVEKNFTLSKDVAPVDIWTDEKPPSSLESCTLSGWGSLTDFGEISLDLRSIKQYPLHLNLCRTVCKTMPNLTDFCHLITESMFCRIPFTESACAGDDGTPLVCKDKLVGLASFGYKCEEAYNSTEFYTNVTHFEKWIAETVEKSGSIGLETFVGLVVWCLIAFLLR